MHAFALAFVIDLDRTYWSCAHAEYTAFMPVSISCPFSILYKTMAYVCTIYFNLEMKDR